MKFIRSTAALIAAALLFSPFSLVSAQSETPPVRETAAAAEQKPKNNEAGLITITALAVLSSGVVHLMRRGVAKRRINTPDSISPF